MLFKRDATGGGGELLLEPASMPDSREGCRISGAAQAAGRAGCIAVDGGGERMRHLSTRVVLALAVTLGFDAAPAFAQQPIGTSGSADPRAVLWRDPGPIAARDLFWAMGRPERAPHGPFAFVEEDGGGTQPKMVVIDARGVRWDVKFGEEAKAEIAANRFVWALGFAAEEMYFVPIGVVRGAKRDGRLGGVISPEGHFINARFRRRDAQAILRDERWSLRDNPFVGEKELSGLMILMTLVANWDIGGTRNTRVLHAAADGGTVERRYAVTDLGASFGRMGGPFGSRSKWNFEDYAKEGFIERVENGVVHLDYDGSEAGVDRVPLEHARWFIGLLAQLTPEQVRRAFEAAGATPEEVHGFSRRLLEKVAQLHAIVS